MGDVLEDYFKLVFPALASLICLLLRLKGCPFLGHFYLPLGLSFLLDAE